MAEELTLEALARRIERIEQILQVKNGIEPSRDWRSVVGMFDNNDFMKQVDEEGRKIREADRLEPLP